MHRPHLGGGGGPQVKDVLDSLGVGRWKLRNKVQVESIVMPISRSNFETGCFQARVSLCRPHLGVEHEVAVQEGGPPLEHTRPIPQPLRVVWAQLAHTQNKVQVESTVVLLTIKL